MAVYSQDKNGIFHGPCHVCGTDVAHDSRSKLGALYPVNAFLLLGDTKVGYVRHGQANGAVNWDYFCFNHIVDGLPFGKKDENNIVARVSNKLSKSNLHVRAGFSSILEKFKHNTPWPGQTEVIVTRINPD